MAAASGIPVTAPQPAGPLRPALRLVVLHALALLGLFVSPPTVALVTLFMVLYVFTGCLGVALAYHRCLAHRAFRFRWKWLERLFVTLGNLALLKGPIAWCGLHRVHHRHSDTPSDPHHGRGGFWSAHLAWIFNLERGRFTEAASDIGSDRYYVWLERHAYVPSLLLLAVLYAFGGWAAVFWGGPIRLVALLHAVSLVNSVAHRYGYRTFGTPPGDTSRNNWVVGLIAFGEGWHNNHHAFPRSARHGLYHWWELDLAYAVLRVLERAGLVVDLRYPSAFEMAYVRQARP